MPSTLVAALKGKSSYMGVPIKRIRLGGTSKANAAHEGVTRPTKKRRNRLEGSIQRVITSNAEKKYLAFSAVYASIDDTTGIVVNINPVVTGTGPSGKIGDSIRTRSLEFNYAIQYGDAFNLVRVLLVIWKPLTVPIVTSVLQFGNATVSAPMSPYNHPQRYDFQVIYDKLHVLDAVSLPAISRKVLITKFPKTLRENTYSAPGVAKNLIYLIAISDSAGVAHPKIAYNGKFNFSDT